MLQAALSLINVLQAILFHNEVIKNRALHHHLIGVDRSGKARLARAFLHSGSGRWAERLLDQPA